MARIVRIHKTGGPEVLQIENIDVPPPGAGEVRIKVKAIGLNRAESMFRTGKYLAQPKFPSRIGYEASGIVESVGSGVSGISPGDIVSVIPPDDMGKYGVYGEIATVPVKYVVKHPPSLSFVEAAAVWMQYMTAYGALSPDPTPFPLMAALSKSLTMRGYILFEIISNPERFEKAKQYILDALTTGKLKPIIAQTFAFENIVEAHRFLESNQQIGKIIITA